MHNKMKLAPLCFSLAFLVSCTNNIGAARRVIRKTGENPYESYIQMESSFFSNWTNDAGSFAAKDATFWGEGYSFEALDTFFRGETAEGWTGTLTSRTWKQKTQYIYFTLGGAKDYLDSGESGDPVFIRIHYGDKTDDFYNNTFVENPMTLRYFKIPDEDFAALTAENDDFDMYIEIIDKKTGGYGFANFGYLHVNQTAESTSDAMRYYLNHLSTDTREWKVNNRKAIYNSYYTNDYQKEVFLRTVENADEDFESGEVFLNHWYFDQNYSNNNGEARHIDEVISTANARTAEESNMPYNKTGNGFFKGWWDDGGRGGFTATDGAIYRFISRPFVLDGKGLVSVKMAGRSASLHVIDPSTRSDLAWIDLRTYNPDGGQYNVAQGGMNTVSMVRHIINLEEFKGKTIQLALADVYDNGWAASYFDELKTVYADYPTYKVEHDVQQNSDGKFYPTFNDVYINSNHIDNDANGVKYVASKDEITRVDSTAAKEAYDFVKNYWQVARGTKYGTNLSAIKRTLESSSLIASFKNLSSEAKAIVNASTDFSRENPNPDTFYNSEPQYSTIAAGIGYLAREEAMSNFEEFNFDLYREAQKTEAHSIINQATEDMNATNDPATIEQIVTNALSALDALKTDEELTAEELVAAKTAAKAELDGIVLAAYRELQRAQVEQIINDAKTAIDACGDKASVATVLQDALDAIALIKTDAEMTAEELIEAKTNAKATLDGTDLTVYRTEEKAVVEGLIANGKTAIDACTTVAQVEAKLAEIQLEIGAVKTDAELDAEELAAAKATALSRLDEIDLTVYRTEEKTTVEGIIADAKNAISEAESIDDVDTLLQTALNSIDLVKTDAEMTAEELAKSKTDAKADLDKVDLSIYRDAEKAIVQGLIADGKDAIDACTTIAEVEAKLGEIKADIGKVKTNAQYEDEERLPNAKTAAKAELDQVDLTLYREAEQNKIIKIIADAKEAIDACETTEEVAAVLGTAKGEIAKLETAAQYEVRLNTTKQNAKAELDAIDTSVYRANEKMTVENLITNGKALIDSCTSIESVASTLTSIKAAIAEVKTDAQLSAEELAKAKADAKAELDKVDLSIYREDQKLEVEQIIADGKTDIDDCTSIDEVEDTLEQIMDEIGAVPTDAEMTASELAQAKTNAKAELDQIDTSVYRDAEKDTVEQLIADGKAAIDACETKEAVSTKLAQIKGQINAVKTDAELTAEELAKAKTDAKAELDEIDLTVYRTEEKAQVEQLIADGKVAIDVCETSDAVSDKLAEVKAAIAEVKTDAQLSAEELAAAKADAKAELDKVDLTVYRDAEKATVEQLIADGKAAIDACETIEAVETKLGEAKTQITAVKTDAQLSAEELAAAKEEAKRQVEEEYAKYDLSNYDEEGQKALLEAKEEALRNIDGATSTDGVATVVADAKGKLSEVKEASKVNAGLVIGLSAGGAGLLVLALVAVLLLKKKKAK